MGSTGLDGCCATLSFHLLKNSVHFSPVGVEGNEICSFFPRGLNTWKLRGTAVDLFTPPAHEGVGIRLQDVDESLILPFKTAAASKTYGPRLDARLSRVLIRL